MSETLVVIQTQSDNTFADVSDWLTQLDASYARLKRVGWDFILTLRAGVDQFGRTDHRKAELYELAATQLGLSPRTLQTYVSLARSPVARIAIELDLEFSHARAALGLDEEVARDLLTTAAEQGWEAAKISREAWLKNTSQLKLRSENGYADTTNIAGGEVPFNHQTRWDVQPEQRTATDEYEQQNDSLPRITNDLGSYRLLDNDTKKCEQCGNLWTADLDYCSYCHVKPEVRASHAAQQTNGNVPHVAHNSGNNEWYTPSEYIEAARRVLGTIELDPASSHEANTVVYAKDYYTIEDDGLAQEWRGRVWMNPPYASDLVGKFIDKLIHHYSQRDVPEAIVLVNNATETQWFQSLAEYASAICFPARRIRFWSPDGTLGAPLQGQAILYLGGNIDGFIDNFQDFGLLVKVA